MPQPDPYQRKYDLSNDDGLDIRTQLDVELDDVARCFLETLSNLALIQRDDGELANRSVGVEQLKAELIGGFNPPAPFQPYRVYETNDSYVTETGRWFIVKEGFTAEMEPPADDDPRVILVYNFGITQDAVDARDAAQAAQAAAELARDQAQDEIEEAAAEAQAQAEAAQAGAEAARDEAQDLVNGAIATASIYPDTATGLANTEPEGDVNRYFSTPSDDGEQFLDLYKNESGTAEFVDSYPNSSALTQTIDTVDRLVSTATYTFDSVADMKADTLLRVGDRARTLGYYEPGNGGGCDYEIVAAGTGSNYGFLYEHLADSGLEAKLLGGGIMEDKTAYIPTDYATLQDAFNSIGTLAVTQGAVITLMLESGYEIYDGTSLFNGDYSHFVIASQDAVVNSSASFPSNESLLLVSNCSGPRVSCFFDMQDRGVDGFNVGRRSSLSIDSGCGVENTGRTGAYISNGSTLSAPDAILRYSKGRNLECTASSIASVQGADLRGGNRDGIYYGACYARRASQVNAQDADFSDTTGVAVGANRGSTFNAMNAKFHNVTGTCGFAQSGATTILDGADVDNVDAVAVAEWGGHATANNAVATAVTYCALRARDGGKITAHNISASGVNPSSEAGAFASGGSEIIMPGSSLSGFERPLNAGFASTIRAPLSDLSVNPGARSNLSGASQLYVNGCTTANSSSAGTPDTADFNVSNFNTVYPLGVAWG